MKESACLANAGILDHAPRFSTLTTCIRAALFGLDAPDVQHMVERNIAVDQERQLRAVRFTHQKESNA